MHWPPVEGVAVIAADLAPGWRSVELSPDAGHRQWLCDNQVLASPHASLVLDVRDRPVVMRVGAEAANGFGVLTADGRAYCAKRVQWPARVEDIHVVLGVGQHAVYVERTQGINRPTRFRWSPVFTPSEEKIAEWIASYPDGDLGGKGKRPVRPPVFNVAMGEQLSIPVREGFCYRMFLIHRPAASLVHSTRFVTFHAEVRMDNNVMPRTLDADERDGEVGWMVATYRFCAGRRPRYAVTASYLDGHAGDPADQLEVRAYVWKAPKDELPTREELAREDEFRCNQCYGVFHRCSDRRERDCRGKYQRCLRQNEVSRKQCGDP